MKENIFDLDYWRERYQALVDESGAYRRKDLIEFNEHFATAKGKDAWFRVTQGRGGLAITRDVCLALEKHIAKKNATSATEKKIIKTQKLVLR
jgi:hypothetical protein